MSEVKKEWLVWKGQAFNKDNPAFEIISAYDTLRAQLAEARAEIERVKDICATINREKNSTFDQSIRNLKECETLRAQLKCAVDALKELQIYDDDIPAQALAEIAKLEGK